MQSLTRDNRYQALADHYRYTNPLVCSPLFSFPRPLHVEVSTAPRACPRSPYTLQSLLEPLTLTSKSGDAPPVNIPENSTDKARSILRRS